MKKIIFVVCLFFIAAAVAAGSYFIFTQQDPPPIISPLGNAVTTPVEPLRSSFIVYGYLPYWNMNKAIYPKALTHVSYFSVPIRESGHLFSDDLPVDQGYRVFTRGVLSDIKALSPHTKVELTLTMMNQDKIPTFLATPSATTTLINDLRQVLKEQPLSGINIDIEYIRGVDETKRSQFTEFMKIFYTTVKREFPELHVSVAVLADSAEKKRLTDIAGIAPYTDHIVIMAYDFHRKGSQTSGANAPLYGKGDDSWDKNIMASAKMFTDIVPAKKLILGIPFYGYEWSVTNTNPYNFTLPDSGMVATYERITKLIASGKATRHWDDTSFTPYLLYKDGDTQQQIYYEDSQSLGFKLDLVKQAGLGGIAIWAMGYEGGTMELWQTISNILGK